MPKLVDHDERRRAIAAATWRLIAAKGIDAANMRDIAAEAGYTNGALSHYFSGKDDILRTSFELIFEATNTRIAAAMGEAKGLAALRIFCLEVMPTTSETLLEARIAASLWQRAMYDGHMEDINRRALGLWRDRMACYIEEARDLGEVGDVDVALAVEQLLNMMMGMQILGVLTPHETSSYRQLAMVDGFLASLRG
ncbi:TetR/AcrR family transcriptional regulator [Rhodococcus sp. BP-252]|uniref:TetR/AcrR family transcriptional regulator n=1 Tax=unclassified Rhodococcus (in: high G+C Gram-positive bacteria) TaxID=192944 RepID=UPI001C9B5F8D|nr:MULTISPECIES: TetR/AcrR family transcriptional regulator [unclassified Rhodococcus (in: high G+C Gram-positive bacteria)]MBY6412847.1 TetR/AcrR family transcriptional regulator [Rhodococcus sp. BP-320]MBY6417616.1 TetR/AcrR family transcriptional regulator [Rhodococcus sp. BP-321]MBY6423468.1 TetR/AcrR family transcriptional regulator [Rhodococcus sp. BP-324]MBY6427640.1 TetR/AcrR family transcriptional regulator [Rhodococcus sp. BP-323]MBY6432804.1 TetR/AcrR family transcriptional regulato